MDAKKAYKNVLNDLQQLYLDGVIDEREEDLIDCGAQALIMEKRYQGKIELLMRAVRKEVDDDNMSFDDYIYWMTGGFIADAYLHCGIKLITAKYKFDILYKQVKALLSHYTNFNIPSSKL